MVKKLLSALSMVMLFSAIVSAQSGTIMGKLIDKETNQPIPFANIIAETAGKQAGGATTNFEGEYKIGPIGAGRYDVKATYVGYKPVMIQNVVVSPDKITFLNIEMESTAVTLTTFEVIDYKVPLIEKDGGSSGGTMTKEEIEKMPGRSAGSVAVTVGGVFSMDGEVGSVRGQRSEGTVMYIDGVRVRGSSSLPKSALDQVQVITGGLPAQYGDATGGIIQVTTRGASREFGGGVELMTSQFISPFGGNLVGLSVQGPLIKGKEKSETALLGFFLSGEFSNSDDGRPFTNSIGVYKAKDDVLEYLENNPLRPSGQGFGSFQNGSYIRLSDLEKMNSKINNNSSSVSLSGRLDVRTNKNSNLAFGGSFNYNRGIAYIHSYSLFNYKNYPLSQDKTWRVWGRYMQRFPSDSTSKSPVKNINYTIQADYSRYNDLTEDANHLDNLFDYGYIGKFTTHKIRSYELGDLPTKGLYDVYIHNGFRDTLFDYQPGTLNPVLATYTDRYYGLYPLYSGMYSNSVLVQNGGGLLNGEMPEAIYGLWTSPGTVYNGYSYDDAVQFGVNAQASADVGRHAIQFGFQYEQRVDRSYGTAPVGLWSRMRQLANKHIEQIDTVHPNLVFDEWGVFQDTVWYNRLYDGASQSFFDYNLRQHLGLQVDGLDWLDIDSYDPSTFSIDWFSADELLNEGTSPYVTYYGYDHTGKKLKSKPSFDDFFTKQDKYGNYTREIPAFEPIYMSGYIQDKFAFKDLIFNVGVRVDRFDANQKVLKDPYLLYEAYTVGDVGNKFGEIPTNMGNDFVVYMDDIRYPTAILGYRDGSTWYNAQGMEITDPTLIQSPGGIAPYLINPELTHTTSAAFKDYEPQISVMPRISFSFPISDEALFFAHYDVLTQRPTTGLRLDPTDYYFINSVGQNVISNPALKPQMTVDYELGFQQMLNVKSAIKFSAYYREMRNQIQVYRYSGAYPISYISYNNIDFGTVKGMTISYDLRRSENVWLKANYTLQFADGTGSNATSAATLVRSGQPNLRIINPLDFDRRHNFSLVFDYRYGKGKNYNGPVISRRIKDSDKKKTVPILQNTGINLTFTGGSGVPYSRSSTVVPTQIGGGSYVLQGSINGSRLPWQFTMNARIDRDITIKYGKDKKKSNDFNVYFEVINVLNSQNILGVYRATGNPDDDGYLSAAEYQSGINAQLDPEAFRQQYALAVNSPYMYSLPRRIRLGVVFNF